MTLRRKLLTLFAGLGVLVLTVVGITFWSLVQWRQTNVLLQEHYARSLLVQRISASTFRAFKELPDAALAADPDARAEFAELLAPVERDFAAWVALAYTTREREQVRQVRATYEALVGNAESFFGALEAGRRSEALGLLEDRLESVAFGAFGSAVDAAVASDRATRQGIRERNEQVRRTGGPGLALAAFTTLSLLLLLPAYLSSDLFRPLRELREALSRAARGDFGRRLDAERHDEFGEVNRAFNDAALALSTRRSDGATGEQGPGESGETATSRRLLHGLLAELREQIAALGTPAAPPAPQELLGTVDRLSRTATQLSAFSFPLDLTRAKTDLRTLLYDALVGFHERFAARAVGLDVRLDPDLGEVLIDRSKIRAVLGELLENALAALPEQGGRIGLRSAPGEEGTFVLEVADNGQGVGAGVVDRALSSDEPGAGLKLSRAVAEEHGGSLVLESTPGEGTCVQLRLPR